MTPDQVAFGRVFDALERAYGEDVYTEPKEVDLNPDKNWFHLKLSVQLPRDTVMDFNQAVIKELNRAGLKTGKPWWKFW
jgi:hypothetical protein